MPNIKSEAKQYQAEVNELVTLVKVIEQSVQKQEHCNC